MALFSILMAARPDTRTNHECGKKPTKQRQIFLISVDKPDPGAAGLTKAGKMP
ncbi:MAG: hypothetical protein WCY98_05540 [Castellaniella sp.]